MRIPWYTAHMEKKRLRRAQIRDEMAKTRRACIRAQCRAMVLSGKCKKEDFTDEIWKEEEE